MTKTAVAASKPIIYSWKILSTFHKTRQSGLTGGWPMLLVKIIRAFSPHMRDNAALFVLTIELSSFNRNNTN